MASAAPSGGALAVVPAAAGAKKKGRPRLHAPTAEYTDMVALLKNQRVSAKNVVHAIDKLQKKKEREQTKLLRKGKDLSLEQLEKLKEMKIRAQFLADSVELPCPTVSVGESSRIAMTPKEGTAGNDLASLTAQGGPETEESPSQEVIQREDDSQVRECDEADRVGEQDLPAVASSEEDEELAVPIASDGNVSMTSDAVVPRASARLVDLGQLLRKDKD